MNWFRRQPPQDRGLLPGPQPKEEPLFVPPVDTSYCQRQRWIGSSYQLCGVETILCPHCGRFYCVMCDLLHVQQDDRGDSYWACDYF